MKKILLSIGMIVTLTGAVIGGTSAFFSDTETSAGNSPVCGLVADGQGYFWGVTRYTSSGTASHGILFRIHELTGVFEMKASFNDTGLNKGRVPQGALYNSGNNPNHVGQNFLRVSNPGGGNQGTGNIPEPGTIALAGLALLGTFRASRRKAVAA